MVPSWTALAGAAIFSLLATRAWRRVVRPWTGSLPPTYPSVFARFLTPEQRTRIESAPVPGAVCLSGIAVLLLSGAWLRPGIGAGQANPLLKTVAVAGLAAFLLGLLTELSVAFTGRPGLLMRSSRPTPAPPDSCRSAESGGAEVGPAGISVLRDDEDSYARLRRYDVFLDGSRVGRLRRGERCLTQVSGGPHTLQVKISWCSSPMLSLLLADGERKAFVCRARPGAASDPVGAVMERHEFLVLHEIQQSGPASPGNRPRAHQTDVPAEPPRTTPQHREDIGARGPRQP